MALVHSMGYLLYVDVPHSNKRCMITFIHLPTKCMYDRLFLQSTYLLRCVSLQIFLCMCIHRCCGLNFYQWISFLVFFRSMTGPTPLPQPSLSNRATTGDHGHGLSLLPLANMSSLNSFLAPPREKPLSALRLPTGLFKVSTSTFIYFSIEWDINRSFTTKI